MLNFTASNNFFDICKAVSVRAEDKINEFDEHITFDEERQKVFLQGIMHASAFLGTMYLTKKPCEFIYDYDEFLKLYEECYAEPEEETTHQISMEEYLEEKNKKGNIEDLAKQVANILMKEFDAKYKSKSTKKGK